MEELWSQLQSVVPQTNGNEEHISIEKELRNLLNLATDLMCILDEEGKIIAVDKGWQALLGWQEREILHTDWQNYTHLEDERKDVLSIVGTDAVYNECIRYRCKGDKYKCLKWRGKWLSEKRIILMTGTDFTFEKQQLNEKIAYEAAFNREALKNEFLSNISHEFKTPINIILSGIQLIKVQMQDMRQTCEIEQGKDVQIEKYADVIKQNGYRLLRLIDNIMEVTRLDAGYVNVKIKNADIIHIVEETTLSTVEYAANKNIKLIFDTEVEELLIACDAVKIERVMLNLISNAIKYMGGAGSIFVNIYVKEDQVLIKVRDTGVGIPEDKLELIFERFTQLNPTLEKAYEGTGLGLSIVKALIEIQGGSIEVTSEVNVGSEFTIRLPLQQMEASVAREPMQLEDNLVEKCSVELSDILVNTI